MTKSAIKAFKRNVGFYFIPTSSNPDNFTDLWTENELYFSAQTPPAEIDKYITDNFDGLFANNTIEFTIRTDVSDTRSYVTCKLPDEKVRDFQVTIPDKNENTVIEDYDIGICYNRIDTSKSLRKDVNLLNLIDKDFNIVIDPITDVDLQASITEHYQSYLLLGITELKRDHLTMSYVSNKIKKHISAGT